MRSTRKMQNNERSCTMKTTIDSNSTPIHSSSIGYKKHILSYLFISFNNYYILLLRIKMIKRISDPLLSVSLMHLLVYRCSSLLDFSKYSNVTPKYQIDADGFRIPYPRSDNSLFKKDTSSNYNFMK